EKYAKEFILNSSTQLIHDLLNLKIQPDKTADIVISTGDITDMYTNLYKDQCFEALGWILNVDSMTSEPIIPTKEFGEFLIKCLEFIWENNYFEEPTYGFFRQKRGIAMGSNASPEIANVTCLYFEVNNTLTRKDIHYSKRFIDDIIKIHSKKIKPQTPYPPNLVVNWTEPQIENDFLDVHIKFNGFNFDTKVHQKELNTYSYPHASSNIPNAIKKGFIKGELIRYIRLSSKQEYYEEIKTFFIFRLLNRGYTLPFIKKAMKNICYANRAQYLIINKKDKSIPLIFKMTYDIRASRVLDIKKILIKNWHLIPHDLI